MPTRWSPHCSIRWRSDSPVALDLSPPPTTDRRIAVTVEQLLAQRGQLVHRSMRCVQQPHPGEQPSRRRGPGLSFDQLRDYVPGDDVRTIDWRATRRSGRAQTRVFHQESEQTLQLVVDQSEAMFFGSVDRLKSVVAAEYASRQLFAALAARQPVAAQLCGRGQPLSFAAVRGRSAALPIVAALAQLNQQLCSAPAPAAAEPTPLAVLEQFAAQQLHGRDIHLIGALQLLEQLPPALLAHLNRRNQLRLTMVIDPLEWAPPAGFTATVQDSRGRWQMLRLTQRQARAQHLANLALWQRWQQFCHHRGMVLQGLGDGMAALLAPAEYADG